MAEKKDPKQRAEEALAVADRKVKKLKAAVAKHEKDLNEARQELAAATETRDYVASHPALKRAGAEQPKTEPTAGPDSSAAIGA